MRKGKGDEINESRIQNRVDERNESRIQNNVLEAIESSEVSGKGDERN